MRRRVACVALLAAVVTLLAACAAPISGHSPHQSTAETPRPTATVRAAAGPGSRVPVKCVDLLTTQTWSALAGASAKVDHDENSAPTNIPSTAQAQFGAESCVWDGVDGASASNQGSYLQIDIAPYSAAQFQGRFEAIMADQTQGGHPAATLNVAGDKSGYWCANTLDALGADQNLPICDGEMLVSGYWVSIVISTVQDLSRAQLSAGITAAMTEIAGKLAAAGAAPAQWKAPGATPPSFCSAPSSTATVKSIVGNQTLVLHTPGPTAEYASTVGLVGPYASCRWFGTSEGSVEISLLAGGAWVFPGFTPVEVADSTIQTFVPGSVPGASAAELGNCGDGGCEAYLAVGTTLVNLYFDDQGTTKDSAILSAFVKAIAAS